MNLNTYLHFNYFKNKVKKKNLKIGIYNLCHAYCKLILIV